MFLPDTPTFFCWAHLSRDTFSVVLQLKMSSHCVSGCATMSLSSWWCAYQSTTSEGSLVVESPIFFTKFHSPVVANTHQSSMFYECFILVPYFFISFFLLISSIEVLVCFNFSIQLKLIIYIVFHFISYSYYFCLFLVPWFFLVCKF